MYVISRQIHVFFSIDMQGVRDREKRGKKENLSISTHVSVYSKLAIEMPGLKFFVDTKENECK